MNVRRGVTLGLAAFGVVVLASFGYGLRLLLSTDGRRGSPVTMPDRDALAARRLRQAETDLRDGKIEQALLTYRQIQAESPSLAAQLGLARGELLAGREDVAAREFERLLEMEPGHPDALLPLAQLYMGRPRGWERAEPLYRAHLEGRPDDAEARLGLARVLSWGQRPREAVGLYEEPAVRRLMKDEDRRAYAFALAAAGRAAEAEPRLVELRAESPDDPHLTRQIAGLRASRGEWDAALPLYRALLDRAPEDPRTNLEYGSALLALGRPAEAVAPLGKAARGLPEGGDAALAYARALRGAGDTRAAEQAFERALASRPRDAPVVREYADLLMERRDYRGAAARYREAMALGLRDRGVFLGLARALQATGRGKEALPLLEEAYALVPDERVGLDLAKLYHKLGRSEDALRLLAELESRRTPAAP